MGPRTVKRVVEADGRDNTNDSVHRSDCEPGLERFSGTSNHEVTIFSRIISNCVKIAVIRELVSLVMGE